MAEFKKNQIAATAIKAYPNPFSNVLGVAYPASMQQDVTTVSVTDLTGKVMGTYNGQVSKVNTYLTELSKQLAPASYLLNVTVEGKAKETIKITKLQ